MCSRTGKEAGVSFLKNRFVILVEKWITWFYFLSCCTILDFANTAEVKFYIRFK